MFRDDTLPGSSNFSATESFLDSNSSSQFNNENNLDDVWGSAPSTPTAEFLSHSGNHRNNEISDIARLRSEHSTAGYREGLSNSKNSTIQEGFDEGYSLGAVLGLEVGTLLGVLEGIYNALRHARGHNESEMWTKVLVDTAKRELKTEEVFGRKWWNEDGTWKFEILGNDVDNEIEFTFRSLVDAHPLIKEWRKVVKEEVEKWSLDLSIMDRPEEERLNGDDES